MDRQPERMDTPPMTVEQLRELRARLIKIAFSIAIGMLISLAVAMRVQSHFTDMFGRVMPGVPLIPVRDRENFSLSFAISLYLGIAFALPVIVYQAIRLLAPDLTRAERQQANLLLVGILACFATGCLLAARIAAPQLINYYVYFGLTGHAEPVATEVIIFCCDLTFWTGMFFALPLLLFLLVSINVLPYHLLRRAHKYVAIGLMLAAAISNYASDALSMMIFWIPMYLLFGAGLILAGYARPRATPSTLSLLSAVIRAGGTTVKAT